MRGIEKSKLLLVDDRPENLLALESALEDLDCQVFKATSGNEALRMVLKHNFALALLDVQMPGMDGFEVAELMRGKRESRQIPIIFVTAINKEQRHVFKGYETGAVDYLFKPLDMNILKSKAKIFIELHRQKSLLELQAEKLEQQMKGLTQEIARRKQVEETLRESEERHRTVLESAPDPVVVYDIDGTVTYLNPAFTRVFGWALSESGGQNIDFVPVEYLPDAQRIFRRLKGGETISGIETCRLTKDGKKMQVSISGAGFFDSQAILQGSVITIQDITERKKTEEEIKFIAFHDVLTGLPNRKSFYMRLEDQLFPPHNQSDVERRRVGGSKQALLFLDLDKFKYVNDTLGHDVGDSLLKVVATRIKDCVRKSDDVFRLSGDEFTILLNDFTDDVDVVKVAEKIREAVARPYHIKDHEIYITISIGISVYPDDGEDVESLVKNADMAMYAAKEEQQGYRFFTEEMNQKALERMRIESSLRTALQDDQFAVYYQPLVNTRNQIVGMEALLRWHHPEWGLLNPSKFIPIAEETGTIIPIGKWVLSTVCHQTKQWYDMGYKDFYVAVNLSTRQFREPDLVETVEQILETTGLPPDYLKLEVTESGIMENPEDAMVKMKVLQAKGIHFSIDDFGTGYSSLSYLKQYPIDTLKIDRSFVMDFLTNKDDREIIKTIIAMANNLDMDTVAEGIETPEQQEFLTHQGCQVMQGYYFGRPMPAKNVEELLDTGGVVCKETEAKHSNTPARNYKADKYLIKG